MKQKLKALPNTSYAVLGLLSFGEALSGYEIRKWAQNMHFFYWSPAQSQVYSELQRLEERGFVTSRKVEQEGKPNKRLYQINEQGVIEFKHWLREDTVEPTIIKHSVALKLFFGHMATPEELVHILEQFIEETREMMGQLGVVQEYMNNEDQLSYPALVAEWGHHYYKAELLMAQKLLERFRDDKSAH